MKTIIDRSTPVTLQHLVNRIHRFTKFAETQPERKDYWETKVEETKSLIVKAVLEHDQNPVLEEIFLKETQYSKLSHSDNDGSYTFWVRTDWLYQQKKKIKQNSAALFEAAQADPDSHFSIAGFTECRDLPSNTSME